MKLPLVSFLAPAIALGLARRGATPFEEALTNAQSALSSNQLERARGEIGRALERDPKSPEAWELRARIAAAAGDQDEQVWSLHRRLALRIAQKAKHSELEPLLKELAALDPVAPDLASLKTRFVDRLLPLAETYEKERRPHSAIRVHQQVLALDPEREESQAAIERISSGHDPSLAETAKPKDLLAGVSEEWMKKFDAENATWEKPGKLERTNYVTKTDAGYAVMVRAAEAMEQMNGFYREFFHYGTEEDGHGVARIELHIFKTRDEYLKLGAGPPATWSGGQFTGSAVETYVDKGGFEEMTTTLFHEAAHQFVGLATSAAGWLNEGLASFFEGSRILANGTVQTNLPASLRLFPLAQRMEKGWMSSPSDGIDPKSTAEPEKAPTFRIVIENKYGWGPPWYAPTWGVVYFLYDYQDPVDGRFVYRAAFHDFINKSSGRQGEGAAENFEKVVLANPQPPTKGVDFGKAAEPLELPKTIDELTEVWKKWTLKLRDEQMGKVAPERPWLAWIKDALARKDYDVAKEHCEKGIVAEPENVDLLLEFARLLATQYKNKDRAGKLALRALQILEHQEKVDEKKVKEADGFLASLDGKRRTLERILEQLEASARSVAQRYLFANRPLMAMEVSWRLGTDLDMPSLFTIYEEAAKSSNRSLALWQLAYNEKNLKGWADGGSKAFRANGVEIASDFGDLKSGRYDFDFLTCDTITSGDYSLEVELMPEQNRLSFAGLVFGRKAAEAFHALIYYPGHKADPEYGITERSGSVDLTTFHSLSDFRVWRHNAVPGQLNTWHKLRLDVVGTSVDVWFDGELVVTQEFPSLDVLRGSFGLITGPGAAHWRNIRFLARHARDPGGAIERALTLSRLKEKAAASGEPVGDSFVGVVPPFPSAVEWLQQPLTGYAQVGHAPLLYLFFSIAQNDQIPVHLWAADLAQRYADVGLRVVAIATPEDAKALRDYLARKPFPGSVGVDTRPRNKQSYGTTFEAYFIPHFKLPRVLLLDVDQRVAWEGEPGFESGKIWQPGVETYLDLPLEEMVKKRHLRELKAWREPWERGGAGALARGDLAGAVVLLKQAEAMNGALEPAVVDAQQKMKALRAALTALDATSKQLERAGGEWTIPTLLKWAELLGQSIPEEMKKRARAAAQSSGSQAWLALVERCKAVKRQAAGKDGAGALQAFSQELAASPSLCAALAREELDAALASGDSAAAVKILDQIEARVPGRWLAKHFGW